MRRRSGAQLCVCVAPAFETEWQFERLQELNFLPLSRAAVLRYLSVCELSHNGRLKSVAQHLASSPRYHGRASMVSMRQFVGAHKPCVPNPASTWLPATKFSLRATSSEEEEEMIQ